MTAGPRGPSVPVAAELARAAARQHGEGLRAVNEKLARLVSTLTQQRERLASFTPRPATARLGPAAHGEPPAPTAAAELALAREALEQRAHDEARIRDRLVEIQDENRKLCDAHDAAQQQAAEFATLYAALDRLRGAGTRAEALEVVEEIVRDVVGAEQFAILDCSADGVLAVARASGFTAGELGALAAGGGTVERALADGATFVDGGAPARQAPGTLAVVAAIPLTTSAGNRLTGVIAIGRLFGHKRALVGLDRELFALLARHAGPALATRGGEAREEDR